jgi:hypothetical protein
MIPTLGFAEDDVECERRFSRTGNSRDDGQTPVGDIDVDVPEVVFGRVSDDDGAHGRESG